jgi:hypothetical protein
MTTVEHLWRTNTTASYLVLVALALLSCFAGYRLFRALLAIWGFIAATTLTFSFLHGTRLDPMLQLVVALVVGVVGAILVTILYWAGVFLLGAGFGLIVGFALEPQITSVAPRLLELVLAVLGGVVALALQRPVIALFTAFGGASVAVNAIAALLASCPLETFPARCERVAPWTAFILGAWVILGVVGAATQWRHAARRRPSES